MHAAHICDASKYAITCSRYVCCCMTIVCVMSPALSICAVMHKITQAHCLQVQVGDVGQDAVDQRSLDIHPAHRLVVVDGQVSAQLSSVSDLPDGVFIGSLQDVPNSATSESLVSHC